MTPSIMDRLWFVAHGSWLVAQSAWLMARESSLKARDPRSMAHGKEKWRVGVKESVAASR